MFNSLYLIYRSALRHPFYWLAAATAAAFTWDIVGRSFVEKSVPPMTVFLQWWSAAQDFVDNPFGEIVMLVFAVWLVVKAVQKTVKEEAQEIEDEKTWRNAVRADVTAALSRETALLVSEVSRASQNTCDVLAGHFAALNEYFRIGEALPAIVAQIEEIESRRKRQSDALKRYAELKDKAKAGDKPSADQLQHLETGDIFMVGFETRGFFERVPPIAWEVVGRPSFDRSDYIAGSDSIDEDLKIAAATLRKEQHYIEFEVETRKLIDTLTQARSQLQGKLKKSAAIAKSPVRMVKNEESNARPKG